MWKAGVAIFTLFNNVCCQKCCLLLEKKNCVQLTPGILLFFQGIIEESIFVCSQFPLKPIPSSSCSVCRDWRNPSWMAQAENSPVCQPEECFSFPHLVPQDVPQFLLGLALPFLPNSILNSASWRKMCLKAKGFYTLLARIKTQMKSETWGRWEHLTLCLSQCQDAEDHRSQLSLKTSTFSCPH